MGYGSGWKTNSREVWRRNHYTGEWYPTHEELPTHAKGDGKGGGKQSNKCYSGDFYQSGKGGTLKRPADADDEQVNTVTVFHG